MGGPGTVLLLAGDGFTRRITADGLAMYGHRVLLASGGALDYDVLVLAPGASARPVLDTAALTLFGDVGSAAVDRVVAEITHDDVGSLAFVIPPGPTRALSRRACLQTTSTRVRTCAAHGSW